MGEKPRGPMRAPRVRGRRQGKGGKPRGRSMIRWSHKTRAGRLRGTHRSFHTPRKGNEMRKNLRNRILGASLAALLVLPAGCATNPDGTTEDKRTPIGALGGGAVGTRAGRGGLIGGVTGAVVGGSLGNYMDRKAAELKRRLPDAALERQGDKLY